MTEDESVQRAVQIVIKVLSERINNGRDWIEILNKDNKDSQYDLLIARYEGEISGMLMSIATMSSFTPIHFDPNNRDEAWLDQVIEWATKETV